MHTVTRQKTLTLMQLTTAARLLVWLLLCYDAVPSKMPVQHLPSVYWQTGSVANVTTIFQYVYMGTACCLAVQDPRLLWSKNTKTKINRTTVLPFVLYGWKTWSRTWQEEHRLRAFESRVLREIFGPDRDTGMDDRGKLCREASWFVIRKYYMGKEFKEDKMGGACSIRGRERRKACSVWLGKIEDRRPLWRPKCRWVVLQLEGWNNLSEGRGKWGLLWTR
jgi:hypothetical protein